MAVVCWARYALPNLLVLFLLLAQVGALAHGVTHILDQAGGDEPVCEQCLAFAPMGAGVASSIPVWQVQVFRVEFDSTPRSDYRAGFRPIYQSRAPPLTC